MIAYRSLAGWRGDGTFGAWLGRIAVRNAIRRAKARRAVARIDPTDPDLVLGAGDAGWDGRADRASLAEIALGLSATTDPALISLRAERADQVRRAVIGLDEPYRETVVLRFFAELSLAEIALETGRPLGTVKTHLFRGLARLRTAMATEEAVR